MRKRLSVPFPLPPAAVAVLLAAACAPPPSLEEPGPALERIALPDGVRLESLALTQDGDLWLGARDGLTVLDPHGGAPRLHRRLPGASAPWRYAREMTDGGVILSSEHGDLVRLADATAPPGPFRPAADAPVHTVVGTDAVFDVIDNSAVFVVHPVTLRRVRAWARLGAASSAVAASPEGDRLYQALESGSGSRLLMRDVQTGRTLMEESLPERIHALAPGRGPRLYTVEGDGRARSISRRRPSLDGAPASWRVPLRDLDAGAEVRLRISPRGDDVAVVMPGRGVVLLDGTDGSIVERWALEALDATFLGDGRLWALEPGSVVKLR